MKYLGEGFYYRVYDCGDGRVFKKLQPYWSSFKKIYLFGKQRGDLGFIQSIVQAHQATKVERKALFTMKKKMAGTPSFLFANPSFKGNSLDYFQDKAVVLEEFFAKNKTEDNKGIINAYIELQKKLWSYGIHDRVYKFQINYGVTSKQEVVFIDFGECLFSKEESCKSVMSKKWLSRQSYKNWEDLELKHYYMECMSKLMTKENLDAIWETNV